MEQVVEGAAAAERPMTPTEAIVARSWAAELRLPRVGLDEDFIDLGSHSLQGLAIVARLEEAFGVPVPVRTLFEEPTVTDLAAWIDLRRDEAQAPLAEIVRLQAAEGSERRPIFALPGGRGDATQLYALAKLAREIDPERPLYGFPGDPPVPRSTPAENWISSAAAAVTARMRAVQPSGPYLLAGVCAGGVIAWEMARQLETAGEAVHLVLIDTRNPQFHAGEGTFSQAVTASLTVEERLARRRRRRERRRKTAAEVLPRTADGAKEENETRRMVMPRAYHPGSLKGRVTLLVNRQWWHVSPTLGWDGLVDGTLDVVVASQEHGLGRHVPEVATHVRAWLDEVDPAAPVSRRPRRAVLGAETAGTGLKTAAIAPPPDPAPPTTVIDALARWADRSQRATALLGPDGETFDYRCLAAKVDRLAETLRGLGIGRGDAVLIVLPDGPAMAITILAAMTAGIAAPLPAEMTRHEYLAAMNGGVARAVILLAGTKTAARDAAAAIGLPIFELAISPEAGPGTFHLTGDPAGSPAKVSRPQPDDVALVISSSGTTGRAKRIPRTHRNIAVTSADVVRIMNTTARERCLNLAPMAFSQGLNALLNTLWAGGSIVALPGFDLARLPERIAASRPTWFSATPTVLRAIAMDTAASAAVRERPPRMIRASAGAISAGEIRYLEERLQAPVLHSYGMSEASFIAGEPFGAVWRKPGSAGLVNHAVKILGNDGQPLAVGETGEIVVRGPNVFPGYADDPAANAAAFLPDGWFRTGDAGRIDADGFLFVTGRLKEMIKRAGLTINPLEIEDALLADPAVAEACVFGVPHPDLGEDVAAAVVVRPGALATERALRARVATRLSPSKVPRAIVFVTEIPKTATGKPLRAELSAAAAAMLAPADERERPADSAIPGELTAKVVEIWAGILGFGPVAADDDLFDLGADSLQAARMLAELQQAFAMDIPPGVLFEERTPARVAAWIAAAAPSSDQSGNIYVPAQMSVNDPG